MKKLLFILFPFVGICQTSVHILHDFDTDSCYSFIEKTCLCIDYDNKLNFCTEVKFIIPNSKIELIDANGSGSFHLNVGKNDKKENITITAFFNFKNSNLSKYEKDVISGDDTNNFLNEIQTEIMKDNDQNLIIKATKNIQIIYKINNEIKTKIIKVIFKDPLG